MDWLLGWLYWWFVVGYRPEAHMLHSLHSINSQQLIPFHSFPLHQLIIKKETSASLKFPFLFNSTTVFIFFHCCLSSLALFFGWGRMRMGAPPKEEQGERVQRSPNQQMKKWNSISLCGVEWNGWICGLWGGAHLPQRNSFPLISLNQFQSILFAFSLSSAATPQKRQATPSINSFLFFYSLRNELMKRELTWVWAGAKPYNPLRRN